MWMFGSRTTVKKVRNSLTWFSHYWPEPHAIADKNYQGPLQPFANSSEGGSVQNCQSLMDGSDVRMCRCSCGMSLGTFSSLILGVEPCWPDCTLSRSACSKASPGDDMKDEVRTDDDWHAWRIWSTTWDCFFRLHHLGPTEVF